MASLSTLSDAFIKHLMGVYSVPQATFLRSITRVVPLFISMYFQGGFRTVLKNDQYKSHFIRLAVSLTYTCCFMYAFSMSSLTGIYTLAYTSSFFMIIFSAVMLKESVGKERLEAVAIGMVGGVIAMRPGTNFFEFASILVLMGTFLGALNKILMRRLAATEHSLSIAIYPNLMMILVMSPVLLFTWESMPWSHWGVFAIVGVITAVGQYCIVQALRFAQGSILAPIDYSTFFWVVALDFVWWQQAPDVYTLTGAAVIVGSNLFILYCGRRDEGKKKRLEASPT